MPEFTFISFTLQADLKLGFLSSVPEYSKDEVSNIAWHQDKISQAGAARKLQGRVVEIRAPKSFCLGDSEHRPSFPISDLFPDGATLDTLANVSSVLW